MHWYVTFNMTKSSSVSVFVSRFFYLYQFWFLFLSLFRVHSRTSASTCLSQCLSPSFTLILSSSWFLRDVVSPWLLTVILLSSTLDSQNPTTTTSFLSFINDLFEFDFNFLIFKILERFMCTCSDHHFSVDRYMTWHSVHFDFYERNIASYVNVVFDVVQSFLMKFFSNRYPIRRIIFFWFQIVIWVSSINFCSVEIHQQNYFVEFFLNISLSSCEDGWTLRYSEMS